MSCCYRYPCYSMCCSPCYRTTRYYRTYDCCSPCNYNSCNYNSCNYNSCNHNSCNHNSCNHNSCNYNCGDCCSYRTMCTTRYYYPSCCNYGYRCCHPCC